VTFQSICAIQEVKWAGKWRKQCRYCMGPNIKGNLVTGRNYKRTYHIVAHIKSEKIDGW
jgi:hypothetical protein